MDDCNINTAFKIAWAKLLRLKKIIYIPPKLKKANFVNTHANKSNVSSAKSNHYKIFRLKCSKTNITHSEIRKIITTTNRNIYLIAALCQ